MTESPDATAKAQTKGEKIRKHVLGLIDGGLRPGDKIPTERELADQLCVSRMTVRQVLKRLEFEGVLYGKQGAGTFVKEQRISKSLELTSFSEDMRSRHLKPGSTSLKVEKIPAGAEIGFALSLSPKSDVAHIHRIRTADDLSLITSDAADE